MNYPFSFEIDYENKTVRFSSTSALPYYDTSLTSCNCEDFEQIGLPCKHIYRLAVELGIINIIKRKPKNSDMYVLAEIYASDDVDSHPEQQKRIKSAKLAKTAPSSLDKENQTDVFPGSGKTPYKTTLHSCTCRDFIVRHLPCKHIYRLKMELGLMPEAHKACANQKEQTSIQLSLEEAVAEIEKLNNITQKVILSFLDASVNLKETSFPLIIKKSNAKIQYCPLLEMSSPIDHSALRVYKRNDLIDILDEQGISGFKRNTSLDKLTEWCAENIPNIWNIFTDIEVFSFSDKFQKAQPQTYDYLCRKYKSIGYFPHSQNDLPDDEVTELLKKYGHIRHFNDSSPAPKNIGLTEKPKETIPANDTITNNNPVYGKVFVLTGTLPSISRNEAKARLEAAGAKIVTAISSKTDYLIAGEAAGTKLQKAKELGIAILNEQDFLELLAEK